MSEIIIYITINDAEIIRHWLNVEENIAWIVKQQQDGRCYWWQAVETLAEIKQGDYCLWHKGSFPLTIPSGDSNDDELIADPFIGWTQTLDNEHAQTPWFGSAVPGPYTFSFKERGTEAADSLGRSGFKFLGNYFGSIGKPAPKVTHQWWARLGRFVKTNATGIPWSGAAGTGKTVAYAFPEAYEQILSGRPRDINP